MPDPFHGLIVSQFSKFVNTFLKLFLKKFRAGRTGSRVLLDPVLGALAGLEGLHKALAPLRTLINPVPSVSQFPHLVSHCLSFLSSEGLSPLCDYMIAHRSGFVNPFFKFF